MTRRPWRLWSGFFACLVWTCLIGFPLIILHTSQIRLVFRDHLHAVVLFAASNGLVFWLFARPNALEYVFDAELVPDDEILTPFRQDEP